MGSNKRKRKAHQRAVREKAAASAPRVSTPQQQQVVRPQPVVEHKNPPTVTLTADTTKQELEKAHPVLPPKHGRPEPRPEGEKRMAQVETAPLVNTAHGGALPLVPPLTEPVVAAPTMMASPPTVANVPQMLLPPPLPPSPVQDPSTHQPRSVAAMMAEKNHLTPRPVGPALFELTSAQIEDRFIRQQELLNAQRGQTNMLLDDNNKQRELNNQLHAQINILLKDSSRQQQQIEAIHHSIAQAICTHSRAVLANVDLSDPMLPEHQFEKIKYLHRQIHMLEMEFETQKREGRKLVLRASQTFPAHSHSVPEEKVPSVETASAAMAEAAAPSQKAGGQSTSIGQCRPTSSHAADDFIEDQFGCA